MTPTRQLLGRQVRHLVVGPAQLEAEHVLLVLALEQHMVAQAARQAARLLQRGFARHVVDARREDLRAGTRRDALRPWA
jgi:hypothetical protein